VWDSVTRSFAQKIGGEGRGENLDGRHWRQLAQDCGLNPKQVFERVGALANMALKHWDAAATEVAAMPAGDHESLALARQAVERRALLILANLRPAEEKAGAEKAPLVPSGPAGVAEGERWQMKNVAGGRSVRTKVTITTS
jgi:hypothetical protein